MLKAKCVSDYTNNRRGIAYETLGYSCNAAVIIEVGLTKDDNEHDVMEIIHHIYLDRDLIGIPPLDIHEMDKRVTAFKRALSDAIGEVISQPVDIYCIHTFFRIGHDGKWISWIQINYHRSDVEPGLTIGALEKVVTMLSPVE